MGSLELGGYVASLASSARYLAVQGHPSGRLRYRDQAVEWEDLLRALERMRRGDQDTGDRTTLLSLAERLEDSARECERRAATAGLHGYGEHAREDLNQAQSS